MSIVAIVLIVLAAVVLVLLLGGFLGGRKRDQARSEDRREKLAEADRSLEQARAADRGWDRPLMEEVARRACQDTRPGFRPDRLDLVLVDDRPGVEEDRAVMEVAGDGDSLRVVLTRDEGGHWTAEAAG